MERTNFGVLANFEERFFQFSVPRLPKFITAGKLTFLAFLSGVVAGISFILAGNNLNWLYVVCFMLFLHWLFDGIDGKTAIHRGESRPDFGYYIDHILDSVTATFLFAGLTTSTLTNTPIWSWVLGFVLVSMIHVFLKTNILNVFQLSIGKVGPTEGRFGFIVIILIVLYTGNPVIASLHGIPHTLFDMIGLVVAIGALINLLPDFFGTLKKLWEMDTKKLEGKG